MQTFTNTYNWLLRKLSPQVLLVLSFAGVILIGTLLLSRPFAAGGKSLSYVDALFTATSATCVTGLIVVDTGSYFSTSGQIIILILIQAGGLGIMTFSTLFLFFLRGRFGIGSREIIQETLVFFDTIEIGKVLKSVFFFTFSFEAIGAVLLGLRFLYDMPIEDALFNAVFQSVSAFCNAGFSTFPDSLVQYRADLYVNSVIMFLIITGGLGFIVIYELYKLGKAGFAFQKLSLHTRVVLVYTASLVVIGTCLLFIFEYNVSMQELGLPSKFLASFFQSVTARTAGFHTIDIGAISMSSLFVLVILMFIGASPASCGGGIKTVTLATILAFIKSKIKDQKNVNLFYNTLPLKVISKAIVIVTFSVITVVIFSFMISVSELGRMPFHDNGIQFIRIFFEVVSAFGTVGLSTGITAELTPVSRIFLSVLMFVGRVGPLTIAVVIAAKNEVDIKYAEANILVG